MNSAHKKRLTSLLSIPIEWDCMMERYTSFSIGGPAEALVRVADKNELQALLLYLDKEGICWRVIGRGTNLLINDDGYSGVIIILDANFKTISKKENKENATVRLVAGAGCSFGRLLKYCIDSGLTGLEFGFGIPGTLGGAVIMNAGAWGGEIASVITRVTVLTCSETITLFQKDMSFSYRCWDDFRKWLGSGVVAEVEFKLSYDKVATIKEKCTVLQKRRQLSQPHEYPHAGSFFKNPPGESAGRLIDLCGLKGTAVGGAMVSLMHGNFLVNRGNATADEVKQLMALIQERVKKEHGIDLQPEVHFI